MRYPAAPDRQWLQTLSNQMHDLLGDRVWGQVRDMVVSLQDAALSGSEKRARAITELRDLGLTVSADVLNLAIEAAVMWASSPNGQPREKS